MSRDRTADASMKTKSVMKSMNHQADGSDLRQCLLVDIGKNRLIVPRVLVVEIIDFEGLALDNRYAPEIAMFSWRGVDVPLVATHVIDPESQDAFTTDSKVVIFHGVARSASVPFYAIKTRRNPRLLNVAEDDITELSSMTVLSEAELMCVDVNTEMAFIPCVDYLESYIHDVCVGNKVRGV